MIWVVNTCSCYWSINIPWKFCTVQSIFPFICLCDEISYQRNASLYSICGVSWIEYPYCASWRYKHAGNIFYLIWSLRRPLAVKLCFFICFFKVSASVLRVWEIVCLHCNAILESILLETQARGPAPVVLPVICEFILLCYFVIQWFRWFIRSKVLALE